MLAVMEFHCRLSSCGHTVLCAEARTRADPGPTKHLDFGALRTAGSRSRPLATLHLARSARRPAAAIFTIAALLAAAACTSDGPRPVVLATTHTVEDTGLLEALTAAFERSLPQVRLRVVVSGSGEALGLGRRGDADVLLTHAPEDEARFVADGYGVERLPIMRNEFVLYGPPADPAGVRGMEDIAAAFRRIEAAAAPFVSRGDDSGTHRRELSIWRDAGLAPSGAWYLEGGLGQADALRLASEREAYMLADRGTYAVVQPGVALVPLSEGDARLENVYSVMRVADAANAAGAAVVVEWLTGPEAAAVIRDLGTDAEGRPLFEALRAPGEGQAVPPSTPPGSRPASAGNR
jgi:tungstate transport system substrate-binding protein